jgi:hypothetical protein
MQHGHLDKSCCKSLMCMSAYKRDQSISARRHWEDERLAIGLERNALTLCAQPECNSQPYVACGHCEQLYCADHLQRHTFTFTTYTRRGTTRVKGDIALCEVCQPYLKEYKRDRYE